VLAAGAVALIDHQWIDLGATRVRLFDVGGIAAIAGLIVAFVVSAVRNTVDLYRAEPLPERERSERAA